MFLYSVDGSVFMLKWNSVLARICKDFCCAGIYDHGVWHGWAFMLQAINALQHSKGSGHGRVDSFSTYTVENHEFLGIKIFTVQV